MPSTIPESYSGLDGYLVPDFASIPNNVIEAKNYASTHSVAESYLWFYNQVRNGGPWDYKQDGSYEGFGNYNYGLVGTAMGIPEDILLKLAGAAQQRAGSSQPEWGSPLGDPPYGDDPLDQQAIRDGIERAKENGWVGTPLVPNSGEIIKIGIGALLDGPSSYNRNYGHEGRSSALEDVNRRYQAARNVRPARDPLALDLDGDGIETIGATGQVLFDHNGDGIRTGTGWVKGDDALLVLDRNGNGTIDNGAELFGVDTVLANGSKATDGFSALRDLDTSGDGVFDSADAQFGNVRVWRDLNQDGVSDAGELMALAGAGIASIALNATSGTTTLAGGNTPSRYTHL